MRRGIWSTIAVIALGLAVPVATNADPGQASVLRVKVDGVFAGDYGCPDTFDLPPAGTVCRETSIFVAKEAVALGGGSIAPPKTPWRLFVNEHTITITSDPNNPIVVSDEVSGMTADPDVGFDSAHQRSASVSGHVVLSDGSTVDVRAQSTAIADRVVYGNNGPENAFEGLARHLVTSCSTWNANAHQKVTLASMTGTVNGVPFSSYSAFPDAFISVNHFEYISVTHGSPGC